MFLFFPLLLTFITHSLAFLVSLLIFALKCNTFEIVELVPIENLKKKLNHQINSNKSSLERFVYEMPILFKHTIILKLISNIAQD